MDDQPHSSTDGAQKEVFRSQQSLGLITQRFMNLRQKNEMMNLNDVAKELNISKRRVYDVINVLEGLGYVQKAEKNNIKWIFSGDQNNSKNQDQLEASVEKLRQQERILELMLKDAQYLLKMHFEDPISRPYSYVSKNDLRTTCSPDSKSIIVKSDLDTNSSFEIQVTDPSTSATTFDMVIRNKSGVKSHALLFTHDEFPVEEAGEKTEQVGEPEEKKPEDVTLTSVSGKVGDARNTDDDLDIEDLETFVIPTTTGNASTTTYTPETPGRGLFLSPFKSLIDPTCILPSYSDDHGYIHITSPDIDYDKTDPGSILDVFSD